MEMIGLFKYRPISEIWLSMIIINVFLELKNLIGDEMLIYTAEKTWGEIGI